MGVESFLLKKQVCRLALNFFFVYITEFKSKCPRQIIYQVDMK